MHPYAQVIKGFMNLGAPLVLYRYRSLDNEEKKKRELQSARDGLVYLAEASKFNDANDSAARLIIDDIRDWIQGQITVDNMRHTIACDWQLYEELIGREDMERFANQIIEMTESDMKKDFIDQMLSKLKESSEAFRSEIHCACFCEDDRSPLMWAYYAADEQGVAFRYELYPEDLLCCCENHCNKCILATIAPVQYGQLPDMSWLSHVLNGSSALTDYPEATSYMCLVNTAFHKTMDWEHEKEWRVVSGTCLSSDKPLYLCARPTAVFLGRLIDPADENDVLILAEELKIPAYKMKRSEDPDGRFEAVPVHCIDS